MLYSAHGGRDVSLTSSEVRELLFAALGRIGARQRVLIVPPDISRLHSRAGELSCLAWEYWGDRLQAVLPALGTHMPMSSEEIELMFPGMPEQLFRVHDWRSGLTELGVVPSETIRELSEGQLAFEWRLQVNRLIASGEFDLILSIGQVVPHEVIGMANYTKNIFIGTGGRESIDKSHYLGAAYGIERIMGRSDTPVRRLLKIANDRFAGGLPIVYVLSVVEMDTAGQLHTRGLYIGDDDDCFHEAARLSAMVNIQLLDRPIERAVVYLDPREYRSTWLGNKAIYRLRMALADDAELIVLAPGAALFRRGCRYRSRHPPLWVSRHPADAGIGGAHARTGQSSGRNGPSDAWLQRWALLGRLLSARSRARRDRGGRLPLGRSGSHARALRPTATAEWL